MLKKISAFYVFIFFISFYYFRWKRVSLVRQINVIFSKLATRSKYMVKACYICEQGCNRIAKWNYRPRQTYKRRFSLCLCKWSIYQIYKHNYITESMATNLELHVAHEYFYTYMVFCLNSHTFVNAKCTCIMVI